MSYRTSLQQSALQLLNRALTSVDAREAVRRGVIVDGPTLHIGEIPIDLQNNLVYAIALGKAAASMAIGLEDVLGEKIVEGVISSASLAPALQQTGRWKSFQGGHPLPNHDSISAAKAALDLINRGQEDSILIALVSGGGSAMIELPASEEITLEDLRRTNQTLVTCGAAITEVNAVRRSISAIKGGRLAAHARNMRVVTLIVSDTKEGDEASVASGPTLPPPADSMSATEVVDAYHLRSHLPQSVLKLIDEPVAAPLIVNDRNQWQVILDNNTALNAAAALAESMGFAVSLALDISEQSIDPGCELLLARVNSSQPRKTCVISGGEFSCPVCGNGIGGRNLETVLRCAIKIHQNVGKDANHTVVLSAGTDGIDGNSFAAGALADEATFARAVELALDPAEYLAQSNSHAFFEALDDLIVTGPTGTNVRDIRIILRG